MILNEIRPYADLCDDIRRALERAEVDELEAWPRVLCALSIVASCRARGETVDHLPPVEVGKVMRHREVVLTDLKDALLTATPSQAQEWLLYFDWLCRTVSAELKRILRN